MYPGKNPDFPGLQKLGWVEFELPDGEQALYYSTRNSGGTQIELLRRKDGFYKAFEFPTPVSENSDPEELAVRLYENVDVEWQDFQESQRSTDIEADVPGDDNATKHRHQG